MRVSLFLSKLLLILIFYFCVTGEDVLASTPPLSILRITPSGEDIPNTQQIIFEFNQAMVSLGKMDRLADEIPIHFSPSVKCHWRWITTKTLACNLDEKESLTRSTTYHILIEPRLHALSGASLDAPQHHVFITKRPTISYVSIERWKSPSLPVLRVVWDQSVTKASVKDHLFFIDPDKQRISLAITADQEKRHLPKWLHIPGMKSSLSTKEDIQVSDDDLRTVGNEEARRIWIVEPHDDLKLDTTYQLHVEPGLLSAFGPALSQESRLIKEFDTFPPFEFLGVRCFSNAAQEVWIKNNSQGTTAETCNPLAPISLQFSAPVDQNEMKRHVEFFPALLLKSASDENLLEDDESSQVGFPHQRNRTYGLYLPFGLKAAQTYTVTIAAARHGVWNNLRHGLQSLVGSTDSATELHDKFGRSLAKPLSLQFATNHRVPNYLIDYRAAVLEKETDSDIPLYVNNLQKFSLRYNRLTSLGTEMGLKQELVVPDVADKQFALPLGLRSMLKDQSGVVWGYDFDSKASAFLNGSPTAKLYSPSFFAEITPYQVHAKIGHFSSLVWVTDLATGKAVEGATITLYRDVLSKLVGPQSKTPRETTNSDGIAYLPGTEEFDPDLKFSRGWHDDGSPRFFVHVRKGNDIAILPIWNQFEIDSYRSSGTSFYPESLTRFGHMVTWGTTAQGIYHPGDSVQYKIYVRNQNVKKLTEAPQRGYWLEVTDPTGKVVFRRDHVKLSSFGSVSGEFLVNKNGAVGWYNFLLKANFRHTPTEPDTSCGSAPSEDPSSDQNPNSTACGSMAEFTWTPLRVLVSDFTPVPFQVRNHLNADLYHPKDTLLINTEASYHAGGPYSHASARITALLSPLTFTSHQPAAHGFVFTQESMAYGDRTIFETTKSLDAEGHLETSIPLEASAVLYGRLSVESAVQDDRGKNVAHQSSADYVGVDRWVGLKLKDWFFKTNDDIAPEFLVVDEFGNPVKESDVSIVLSRKETTAARVKNEGNSYLPQTESHWVTESRCQGKSEELGVVCHLKGSQAGDYLLKATVTDTHGVQETTTVHLWMIGAEYVYWDSETDTNLDIIADHDQYHIGDVAHFLVKNPYPGAKALITVERYGVLDHFVETLPSSTAVVNLPIKAEYLPGFYLSITVFSPRVDKPPNDHQVDLGKPTFRMGYTRVDVKDVMKEVSVDAHSDREIYRPGDTVTLSVHAQTRMGSHEPLELAVAVLDESVFDLIASGKDYYDPYHGFYHLDRLDLQNYSLLTRLVGRQKFEKKGANPGGDGGTALSMRTLFKYVSYWNPAIHPDGAGNASVTFTVPDNLTGWRVLVLANTKTDQFGLGETSFKVNRPTEIRPEMPNQVTEGDTFEARFSVMNRTKLDRTLTVNLSAEGTLAARETAHLTETLTLKPFERKIVSLPLTVATVKESADQPIGHIHFTAEAGDLTDRDGMHHDIPVYKQRSLDQSALYETTTDSKVDIPIQIPDDIYPDIGEIRLDLTPTVISNVDGAFRYMRDYPYTCWEQVLTKGVMAAAYGGLKAYVADWVRWPEADHLTDITLASAHEYQAPNGGMTYFIATDDRVDPYLSAYTALAFNWLRKDGYTIPSAVDSKLNTYLLNYLRHDETPSFYTEGMSATVRAVALAALAEQGKVTSIDLERYASHVKEMSLFGKAMFTKAALALQQPQDRLQGPINEILAHGNETSGKFIFSETYDDSYSRILGSSLRDNCAILELMTDLQGKKSLLIPKDVPFKLLRSISQSRGSRDHWENTQDNIFCMNAFLAYSRQFEAEPPSMLVTAKLNDAQLGETQFNSLRDPPRSFHNPLHTEMSGQATRLSISKEGKGRLYYTTRLSYALRSELAGDQNNGLEIHREYSEKRGQTWALLNQPLTLHQGDLVRVDLYLSLPAARNFVVVDDPIPGGFEAVNADLANASQVDAQAAAYPEEGGFFWLKYHDWTEYNFTFWSFNHMELLNHAARFYADYLNAGRYHLSYMIQAIGVGNFTAMPTHAEEMYDPDTYGKTASTKVHIETK